MRNNKNTKIKKYLGGKNLRRRTKTHQNLKRRVCASPPWTEENFSKPEIIVGSSHLLTFDPPREPPGAQRSPGGGMLRIGSGRLTMMSCASLDLLRISVLSALELDEVHLEPRGRSLSCRTPGGVGGRWRGEGPECPSVVLQWPFSYPSVALQWHFSGPSTALQRPFKGGVCTLPLRQSQP